MTFTCDIYLVEIVDNVSAFFDDMAYLLTLADKNTMTLKDALNEPDAEEFVKAMIKEVDDQPRVTSCRLSFLLRCCSARSWVRRLAIGSHKT